jgi:hypothetical protein
MPRAQVDAAAISCCVLERGSRPEPEIYDERVDEGLTELLAGAACGAPATPEQVASAQRELGVQLPSDLVAFYESFGAADGDLTSDTDEEDGGWLILHPVDQLVDTNVGYDHRDKLLVIVGSDGGGEAYALDYRVEPPVWVVVPFIDLGAENALPAGGSLVEFLIAIRDNTYWDR